MKILLPFLFLLLILLSIFIIIYSIIKIEFENHIDFYNLEKDIINKILTLLKLEKYKR